MPSKTVLICQNTPCRKAGSAEVLTAFQSHPLSDVTVLGSRCLGQCGNGPMVLVLPEETWYCGVRPEEVAAVVQHHLLQGEWIRAMLYPKFHTALKRHSRQP